MTLSKKYQEYVEAQTHVSETTLGNIRRTLARFPPVSRLNAKWFRQRMKKVSAATTKNEITLAKNVLRHFNMDTADLDAVKIPRLPESVTIEDLLTKEELNAIWNACHHTRDKALYKVLYESACRANEVLSMTFKNVVFEDDNTAKIIVKGKTGTRQVPIFQSVPALKAWFNVHPTKKGRVWVKLQVPYEPLRYSGMYARLEKIVQRAGITRPIKRLLHMFGHTRITELVRLGVRGQALSKLVGWSKRSNMESIYVHLSTADVENEVRSKVFGLEPNGELHRPLSDSKKCPKCGIVNDEQNVICSECNMPLTDNGILRAIEREESEKSTAERLQYLEERFERMTHFLDRLGEEVMINVGTEKEPKYRRAYLVKEKEE